MLDLCRHRGQWHLLGATVGWSRRPGLLTGSQMPAAKGQSSTAAGRGATGLRERRSRAYGPQVRFHPLCNFIRCASAMPLGLRGANPQTGSSSSSSTSNYGALPTSLQLHTRKVAGSIPAGTTRVRAGQRLLGGAGHGWRLHSSARNPPQVDLPLVHLKVLRGAALQPTLRPIGVDRNG